MAKSFAAIGVGGYVAPRHLEKLRRGPWYHVSWKSQQDQVIAAVREFVT
jgi:hypothetical protein